MKQKFLHSFYALFLFTGIVQAQQTTRLVTLESDDGSAGTLRQVIADSKAGDTIIFAQDVHNIELTKSITINNNITISGNGPATTKIDGKGIGRIFTISARNVTLENMLLTNGQATNGGAIYSERYNLELVLNNLEISNSGARYGGAIAKKSGKLILTNCNLINNTAQYGTLYADSQSTVNITGGTISKNLATDGGGIYLDQATLTMTNSNLINNAATYNGGGLYLKSLNPVNITGGTISGNTAEIGGGMILYGPTTTTTLDKVTIASNTASQKGGGLFVYGQLTITNSAIVNNSAMTGGGGLYCGSVGLISISTSTFSGNAVTPSYGYGGAIYNEQCTNFTLNAATVVDNLAGERAGGIYNGSGTTTLKNTIVAKNNAPTGSDLYTFNNSFVSSGYNLIGKGIAAFTATTGDLVGTATAPIDPKIGNLANNGGSTLTHKLLPGSPAYNTGNPEDRIFPNDQIGQTIFGGRWDIGAYEAQEELLGNTVFDVKNSNSTVWPNPSNGTIKINLSNRLGSTAKGSLIEIASGKTVSEFAVNGNSEINLQNYAAGLYIVRLESESVTENHKLIIQ